MEPENVQPVESDTEAQSAKPDTRAIHITFGGLCSFVPIFNKEEVLESVQVLLIEPTRASVDGDFCKHDRFLIFSAKDYVDHKPKGKNLFRSFISTSTREVIRVNDCTGQVEIQQVTEPETLFAWKIDGRDLKIDAPGDKNGLEYGVENLLSLKPYKGHLVRKKWLKKGLWMSGLVGARVTVHHGVFVDGIPTELDWAMCPRKDPCDKAIPRFSQTIEYTLESNLSVPQKPEVTIEARIRPLLGTETLKLNFGSRIFISNTCPSINKKKSELDVLAYYDLAPSRVDENERRIPFLLDRDGDPQASACPPTGQNQGP